MSEDTFSDVTANLFYHFVTREAMFEIFYLLRKENTVEPRYLELAYFELTLISK